MNIVEEAIRMKEGKGGRVSLFCMGPPSATEALRSCLSLGADRAMLLWDAAFLNSDSYATAVILAKAISLQQYDLILCGHRAVDTEAGQVGAVIAEILGLPLVSKAIRLELDPGCTKLTAHRRLERGNVEVLETLLPAVVTVEAGLNKPRYPKLRSIMAAQRKAIEEYDLAALGLPPEQVGASGSKTVLLSVSPTKPRLNKPFAPDSSLPAAERIRLLMSGGIADKKGDVAEGDAQALASKVLQFLAKQRLLS